MGLRKILTDAEPALHKVCRPVTSFDLRLHKLLKDMKEKMNRRLAVVRELTLADGSKDIGAYYAKHEEIRFGE